MIGFYFFQCLLVVPVCCHLLFSDIKELFESPDQVCQNDNYSKDNFFKAFGIKKFTGIRVFKVYKMTLYPISFEESIRFIYCDEGKRMHHRSIIQDNQDTDAYWAETFDIPSFSDNIKLKFSKREGYINHDKSYVIPGSIIGGLFHCFDNECTPDNSEPILPVYSYMHESIWTQTTRGDSLYNWTIEKYVPLMSTTNDHTGTDKLRALVTGYSRHRTVKGYMYDRFGIPHAKNITNTCTEKWCVMI